MKLITTRVLSTAMLAGAVIFVTGSSLRADNKDTPDDVIRAGRNASAELNSMQTALRDAQAITARMERDRAFATRMVEAANKNDKQALTALLTSEARGSQVSIQGIRDFALDVFLTVGGTTYRFCVSSEGDCRHPSGQKSAVAFSQF